MRTLFTLHPSEYSAIAHWTISSGSKLGFRNGLKLFRKSTPLTQHQFAKSIGYSTSHFTGIENGNKPVSARIQAAILAAYQPVTITPRHEFITAHGVKVSDTIGLQAVRAQQGWSRQELAGKLCVSVHTVHNWLAGKHVSATALQVLYLYQELSLCKKVTQSS